MLSKCFDRFFEAKEAVEVIEAIEATEVIEAAEVLSPGTSLLRTSESSRILNSDTYMPDQQGPTKLASNF